MESVQGRGREGCSRSPEEQMRKASMSFEMPPKWPVGRLAAAGAAATAMAGHLVALEGRIAPSSHCFPTALRRLEVARSWSILSTHVQVLRTGLVEGSSVVWPKYQKVLDHHVDKRASMQM